MKNVKVSMVIIIEKDDTETRISTKGFQTPEEAITMLERYKVSDSGWHVTSSS